MTNRFVSGFAGLGFALAALKAVWMLWAIDPLTAVVAGVACAGCAFMCGFEAATGIGPYDREA